MKGWQASKLPAAGTIYDVFPLASGTIYDAFPWASGATSGAGRDASALGDRWDGCDAFFDGCDAFWGAVGAPGLAISGALPEAWCGMSMGVAGRWGLGKGERRSSLAANGRRSSTSSRSNNGSNHTCAWMHIDRGYRRMHIYLYLHLYLYLRVYIYIYIYKHIYICIQTCARARVTGPTRQQHLCTDAVTLCICAGIDVLLNVHVDIQIHTDTYTDIYIMHIHMYR